MPKHFKFKHFDSIARLVGLEGDVDWRREDSRDLGWKANKSKQKRMSAKIKGLRSVDVYRTYLERTPMAHVLTASPPTNLFI